MARKTKQKARMGKATAMQSGAPVLHTGAMVGKKNFRFPKSQNHSTRLHDRWVVLGICLFLVTIVWLVFGQTLGYDFVNYDDDVYVYNNPQVTHGLTPAGVVWSFTHIYAANWHPLTWISHMLDCQFYGLNPEGHHFTNVLLHTITVILLFLVLRQMTGFLWRSAFVAAVFAIHPLRVESVAWIAERKDVLSGVFFMLTIGAYVRYARGRWEIENQEAKVPAACFWRSTLDYSLVLFFFALGLMCKPTLVTLPLVLLLLDYWPLDRTRAVTGRHEHFSIPGRLILEKLPLFGMVIVACMVTLFAQTSALTSLEEFPMHLRVGNALISCVAYIRQMFWPEGLALFYPFSSRDIGITNVVLSLIVLTVISAGVFVLRRHRYLLTGWLWYLIMLAPVIGVVQVGVQAHADRYTYLPQIGLYLLLTWAVADACLGLPRRRLVLGCGSAAILAGLMVCAHAQTAYWRNSETLWTRTLVCTSDNYPAELNLGNAFLDQTNLNEAIVHFQAALEIKPDYMEALNDLGNALLKNGDVKGAMVDYQRALQIMPNSEKAHSNMGNVLFQIGQNDEAIAEFQKALQIDPDNAGIRDNLGSALFQMGRVDEAIPQFQMSLKLRPDDAEACYNLGRALFQTGKADEAIAQFKKALEINPDYAEAQNDFGNILFQMGRADEAIPHYQKALQLQPDNAGTCCNLANALFLKNDMGGAIAEFQRALQITPDNTDVLNSLAWLLATCPQASLRNGSRAVELAQQANQLTGSGNPLFLATLGAAYAETGQFPEAVTTAEHALQLAEAESNSRLADGIRTQINLYRSGSPFHLH